MTKNNLIKQGGASNTTLDRKPKASSDSYTFLRRVVVKTGLSLLKYLKI